MYRYTAVLVRVHISVGFAVVQTLSFQFVLYASLFVVWSDIRAAVLSWSITGLPFIIE